MQLARQITVGLGIVIAINLLAAFASIVLLNRMTPAIEVILRENVYSLEAVDTMLTKIASEEFETNPDEQDNFRLAFLRARKNVTEIAEPPLLRQIERSMESMFDGKVEAKQTVITALMKLGDVNREAMRRADKRARRLGTAGAWAMVFLGSFAFAAGIFVLKRLVAQIARPSEEIWNVLKSWRQGETQRRCRNLPSPGELSKAITEINLLLDEQLRLSLAQKRGDASEPNLGINSPIVRRLIDFVEDPAFIVDAKGELVFSNKVGIDALAGEQGVLLREALSRASLDEKDNEEDKMLISTEAIPETEYLLCRPNSK